MEPYSEESGEIALSVLSHSQPPTNRSDLKNTQDYWLLTRQRYLAVRRFAETSETSGCWYSSSVLPMNLLILISFIDIAKFSD